MRSMIVTGGLRVSRGALSGGRCLLGGCAVRLYLVVSDGMVGGVMMTA